MGSTTISSGSKFGRSCYSIALCYIPTLFGSLNYPGWANMASIDFSKQEYYNFELLSFEENNIDISFKLSYLPPIAI